jgi:hypothetical protein
MFADGFDTQSNFRLFLIYYYSPGLTYQYVHSELVNA